MHLKNIYTRNFFYTWPLAFVITVFAISCGPYDNDEVPKFPVKDVEGFRPVYATSADTTIMSISPQPLSNPGKIYVYGPYLFINERYEGIHIINNIDVRNPTPIGFIKVKGNIDFAVKSNVLYADQFENLLAFDITNPLQVTLISKFLKVYEQQNYPIDRGFYFECPDPAKGLIIGWEKVTLNSPECYR